MSMKDWHLQTLHISFLTFHLTGHVVGSNACGASKGKGPVCGVLSISATHAVTIVQPRQRTLRPIGIHLLRWIPPSWYALSAAQGF